MSFSEPLIASPAGRIGSGPRLSVVTPFYNSAGTLARCIESVLSQSFGDFEYLLSDNLSNDGSYDIAAHFAARDPRIKLFRFTKHVGQTANYNRALRLISPNARYCKIVQADDYLLGSCLNEMIGLADRYPSVGLISSVREIEDQLDPPESDIPEEFSNGRDIARRMLLGGSHLFGSPTTVMYRADLVRARQDFYPDGSFFDDNEVALSLLRTSDFAFSSRTLTHTSRDPDSTLGKVISFDIGLLFRHLAMQTVGGEFFPERELLAVQPQLSRDYHEALLRALMRRTDRAAYLTFHRRVLAAAGLRPRFGMLARCAAGKIPRRILQSGKRTTATLGSSPFWRREMQ